MQEEYECVYCVVDVHALTTLTETEKIIPYTRDIVLDWLAAGMDPERAIIIVQSHVPEVMELHTYFSMMSPLSWLLRVPTFKEKVKQNPENVNYGLVGYPVLQAADILLYKAEAVPVGEDQLPHLEFTREIARRFNNHFGETFPEPQAKLTSFPLIVGLDGSDKMGKSSNNTIELAMDEEETKERVMSAVTDPARRYRKDPGHPEVCNIYKLDEYFSPLNRKAIADQCRKAEIGCVEHKQMLAENINNTLRDFREKRAALAAKSGLVEKVLADGAKRASVIARETMAEVRRKMGLA